LVQVYVGYTLTLLSAALVLLPSPFHHPVP
jgi:hypothetical protein